MKLVLFSTGCPRCETLKKLLDRDSIEYNIVSDIDEIKLMGIEIVPVIMYNNKKYSFMESIDLIKELVKKQKGDKSNE